jgi:hypothetical protein
MRQNKNLIEIYGLFKFQGGGKIDGLLPVNFSHAPRRISRGG